MDNMLINDRVYGIVEIKEPVLIELIDSKPVQRLKRINQAGAAQYAIAGKTVTRYEHSIGVMILLRKLGASLEEQIAGLLHDIPHTAFSHVIDFVFPSKDHTFHEKFHEKIIIESEIPEILEKHGFDLNRLLDEHNFPLLERKIPDLCADRIDYALRDIIAMHIIMTDSDYKSTHEVRQANGEESAKDTTKLQGNSAIDITKDITKFSTEKIEKYIAALIIHDNEIIFSNSHIAKEFAEDFIRFDEESWSHPRETALFQILADAVKIGLDSEILSEQDLFQDDEFVYNKLKNSRNEEILKRLEMINPNLRIIEDKCNHDFFTKNKLRYVDPKFIIILTKSSSEDLARGEIRIKRVSEEFPEFLKFLNQHIEKTEKGNFVKIVGW